MSYVNNIRMFVRVYELGSMSAAARDQRRSPPDFAAIADMASTTATALRVFSRRRLGAHFRA